MGGAAILVDVDTVWLGMNPVDLSPYGPECRRRRLIGGPVRTVDDDPDAFQAGGAPEAVDQVCQVRLDQRLLDGHPANAGASWPRPRFNQPRFDGVLEGVVQLVAAARKELDAVVGHRVVTGRQHDAEICVAVLGEERNSRSWQHPEPYHVDAGAGQTCHDGGLQELT